MENLILPLDNVHERHYGLSLEVAQYYLLSARVCLDRHHSSPAVFDIVDDAQESQASVAWEPADDRGRSSMANRDDATRDGAYICAIAATELRRELFAVQRAETLTGADYYVAPMDCSTDDMEDWLRLEVSGTDSGNKSRVNQKLKEKIQQAQNGKSNLPAIAAIVGFKSKLIAMETVPDKVAL
jgi:hypothetical protein